MIFYNEFNPESAAMIRQFMADGLIAPGIVDERSIEDLDPDELRRYTQCHFFAGFAGWTFALQDARWQSDRPVWTGSCPCQPFSSAGKQEGKKDTRHLWPVWERLIRECRPASVYGEQVSTAIAHGWLDDVYQGLEPQGYAVGSSVLPACSVGSPHKRYRLWFVAHSSGAGLSNGRVSQILRCAEKSEFERCCGYGALEDSESFGRGEVGTEPTREQGGSCFSGSSLSSARALDHTFQSRLEGQPRHDCGAQGRQEQERSVAETGFWDSGIWIDCPDGKKRLVEPGIPLLANGLPYRRPILHALGNGIVRQCAAKFIEATM